VNKTAIKNFAIWARRKLIGDIVYKAGLLGITQSGIKDPLTQSTKDVQFFDIGTKEPYAVSGIEIMQREKLVDAINENAKQSDYVTGYKAIIEEVAYTWFNRLIAIRFMEVNDYLPSGVRVLSSANPNKIEPDLVTKIFEAGLELTTNEQEYFKQLTQENQMDKLFRFLFIKQCNELNAILPNLFEKTSDYTELLLNASFSDKEGVIYRLVNEIEENNFRDAVEIIGWLYQYYNTEPKDEVFSLIKKNVKITKERIPAATQLFTPDWIVRYMVENSLGRLWVEGHPNEELKDSWKYYIEEAEQEASTKVELQKVRAEYKLLTPTQIKIIDPCMGSGHILVYAFDVLMQIYQSQGYTKEDAAVSILENNLYGIDIDDRAYQLAYFAVMMRARKYNRNIFSGSINPMLFSIKESNGIAKAHLKYFGASLSEIERRIVNQQMEYLIDAFHDAKEYGSMLSVDKCNWELLQQFVQDINSSGQISLENIGVEQTQAELKELIKICESLAQKYDVVVTNPPYAGSKGINSLLSTFIEENYNNCKSDIYAVFLCRCICLCNKAGIVSLVMPTSWMYNYSFAKLRSKLIGSIEILNLVELGDDAFQAGFGTAMLTLRKSLCGGGYRGYFFDVARETSKSQFSQLKPYTASMNYFTDYQGNKILYKIEGVYRSIILNTQQLNRYGKARSGLQTNDNSRFIREWFEVSFDSICLDHHKGSTFDQRKWFPHVKGGAYRKWYGNLTSVVNWQNDGKEIKENASALYGSYTKRVQSMDYYFCEALTWSHTTYSQPFALRYLPEGVISNVEGPAIFELGKSQNYMLALLNSKVMDLIFQRITDSIHYLAGEISRFPVIYRESEYINNLAKQNINISKDDWDTYETSWSFVKHPLVVYGKIGHIRTAFENWTISASTRYSMLKENEQLINREFISIYGLNNEVSEEVEGKSITIRQADLRSDIISLISYAVGCMFGRYSLEVDGLAYAGGDWDINKFKSIIPDKDNCIPITDEEYFVDDIVDRFVEFIRCIYGAETLEENLNYIAEALDFNGVSSRDGIRTYFVKDFFKDHLKTYQKRPIYWLYESGKENGFKALIYLHRYSPDTTGVVRVEYLHKIQKIYEGEIVRLKEQIDSTSNPRKKAQSEKRRDKVIKQLKETQEYDEKIAHLALVRVSIDLDDGVVNNYQKVQTDADGKSIDILARIK